jgi:hypothetical protein
LADFIAFANKDASELTLENKLVAYFNDASQQKLEDGNDRYRAASFRSWNSVFAKFWKYCKFKDLKAILPQIEDKIGKWEKLQVEAKQAMRFEKEGLLKFFGMATTAENLADKTHAAIALSYAARGVEVTYLTWDDVTRSIDLNTGEKSFGVSFQRTKTSESKKH